MYDPISSKSYHVRVRHRLPFGFSAVETGARLSCSARTDGPVTEADRGDPGREAPGAVPGRPSRSDFLDLFRAFYPGPRRQGSHHPFQDIFWNSAGSMFADDLLAALFDCPMCRTSAIRGRFLLFSCSEAGQQARLATANVVSRLCRRRSARTAKYISQIDPCSHVRQPFSLLIGGPLPLGCSSVSLQESEWNGQVHSLSRARGCAQDTIRRRRWLGLAGKDRGACHPQECRPSDRPS